MKVHHGNQAAAGHRKLRTPHGLARPQDIDLFHALAQRGLVRGECYTTASGEQVVAVHGPTPDGRALLALENYMSECESGQRTVPQRKAACG